jgi:hypothetical protein
MGRFEQFNRLLQVNDINSVSCTKDILFHLWVPAFGLMSEMDTCFQKFSDCNVSHLFSKLINGFSTIQIILKIRLFNKAPDLQVPECEFFIQQKS